MRLTADTNFLISAIQWDNSIAHKLLIKLLEKNIEIFITKEIMKEFSKVLKRDFRYSPEEIIKIIEKIILFVSFIETTSKIDVVKEDIDDNKILECAIDSNSEYTLTYDKHLLKLKEFQGIKIIKPDELLFILEN